MTNTNSATKNPRGQLIKTNEGIYKYIPLDPTPNNYTTALPVNFRENDFNTFDSYGFMNSQTHEPPVVLKLFINIRKEILVQQFFKCKF
jgi:hypothetical protein